MKKDGLDLKPLRLVTEADIKQLKNYRYLAMFECVIEVFALSLFSFVFLITTSKNNSGNIDPFPLWGWIFIISIFLLFCFFLVISVRTIVRLNQDIRDGMIYELKPDDYQIKNASNSQYYYPVFLLKITNNQQTVRYRCFPLSRMAGVERVLRSAGPHDILEVTKNLTFIVNK